MMRNILLVGLLGFFMVAKAQRFPGGPPPNYQEKQEKIKAHKVAFITNELNLNTKEAEVFWPVYNEFAKEEENLRMEQKNIRKQMRSLENLSDAQIEESIKRFIVLLKNEVLLKESFQPKFIEVIGPRKTARLYKAEIEFKKVLLQRLRGGPPIDY